MRTVTTKVYLYKELSDQAKKNAIEKSRYDIAAQADEWDSEEYRECLEEIEKLFDIKVHKWEVSSSHHYCRYEITDDRWSEHDDEPKMLLRYLNEMRPYLFKGKYYSGRYKNIEGKLVCNSRRSKVFFDMNCPLTGTWTDIAVEKSIEKAYERVRSGWTIKDFIDDMLDRFFEYWETDLASHLEDEFVEEEIINNEVEFLEDGTCYC